MNKNRFPVFHSTEFGNFEGEFGDVEVIATQDENRVQVYLTENDETTVKYFNQTLDVFQFLETKYSLDGYHFVEHVRTMMSNVARRARACIYTYVKNDNFDRATAITLESRFLDGSDYRYLYCFKDELTEKKINIESSPAQSYNELISANIHSVYEQFSVN